MDQRVTILGAGFSKAIGDKMPLTDRLGELVLDGLAEIPNFAAPRRFSGYFEAWLSRIAEDQPDLDAATNFFNRGLFEACRRGVVEILEAAESQVLRAKPPPWLATLCAIWHKDEATILTFNYDTLVERAINHHHLFDWNTLVRAQADDVIDRLPALPPGPARLGPGPMPRTARLLKLHGSTAWFASPTDQTGASLARRVVRSGWTGGEMLEPGERRREFAGREPFVVPPATAKSGYYTNPVLRQLWQNAGEAVSNAAEVHLLGYSLPAADLTTRGLLTERSTELTEWVVVNPAPDPVVDSLVGLGADRQSVRTFKSVEEYVDDLERISQEQAIQQVLALSYEPSATPIVAAWGQALASELAPADSSSGTALEARGQPESLSLLLNHLRDQPALTLGQLPHRLTDQPKHFHIDFGDGAESVIDARFVPSVAGHIPTDCVVLSVGRWPPRRELP